MHRLEVALGARTYPIWIGSGLLSAASSYAPVARRHKKIITDSQVAELYLPGLLEATGLTAADALILPVGEQHKNWQTAGSVLDWIMSTHLPRDGVVLALGGGVVGDLAGFCAAIYQRGIDFVQVPTTLLAQVDSAVGGKTAVNHPRGKNMLGAFHQPLAVIADTDVLKTLPARELMAGFAEVIKYAMLGDREFFSWLELNVEGALALDGKILAQIIERCCAMKAAIVSQDERESQSGTGGPRTLLNLGHTFAHAIETHTAYAEWLHGEAVAVGLCMAADLSARSGWISAGEAERCTALVARVGLPTAPPAGMAAADFRVLMSRDKKVAAGRVRLVLLRRLGEAFATADFEPALLEQTLNRFCTSAQAAPLTA